MNSTANARRRSLPVAAKVALFVAGVVVLLVVGCVVYLFAARGEPMFDREREGSSLRIPRADGSDLLVTLVEAERLSLSRYGRNRGSVGLELLAHDAVSARPLWSETLVRWHRAPVGANSLGRMLGHDGRQLWLMAPRLQIFDLRTREKRDGIDALERANPQLKGLLTSLWKHLDFDRKRGRLGFVAADGRQYRVEPQTLRAVPFEPEARRLPEMPDRPRRPMPGDHADGFNAERYWAEQDEYEARMKEFEIRKKEYDRQVDAYLGQVRDHADSLAAQVGQPDNGYHGLMVDESHWLGLYTDEELQDEQPGTSWSPTEQVYGDTARRRLYRITLEKYVWHKKHPDDLRTRIDAVEPLAESGVWLQGGMLREPGARRALRLRDPDGVLVMHRDRIDSLGTVRITRIGFDGKPLWTVDTGLATITQVFSDDEYVLFTGLPPQTPQSAQRRFLVAEQLVSVATADGAVARDDVLVGD